MCRMCIVVDKKNRKNFALHTVDNALKYWATSEGQTHGCGIGYIDADDKQFAIEKSKLSADDLKFTKYGFGRATDHACFDIRNGLITRKEGLDLVLKYDGKYPYYGVEAFKEYSGMSQEEIDEVIDRFTNKQIFQTNPDGAFRKDIAGNLVRKEEIQKLYR